MSVGRTFQENVKGTRPLDINVLIYKVRVAPTNSEVIV